MTALTALLMQPRIARRSQARINAEWEGKVFEMEAI